MKDKIEKIIQTLIDSTLNGNLKWEVEESYLFVKNDNTLRKMVSFGTDGSKFTLEVKFIHNKSVIIELDKSPGMFINNEKIPKGIMYIDSNYGDIVKLRDIVKDKFCSDMKPSGSIESVLDSICNSITISELRDSKIDDIFNNG